MILLAKPFSGIYRFLELSFCTTRRIRQRRSLTFWQYQATIFASNVLGYGSPLVQRSLVEKATRLGCSTRNGFRVS